MGKSRGKDEVDRSQARAVLSNMIRFSNKSRFFSLVMASAARQLDHHSANSFSRLFNKLDSNHDGILDMQEMHQAFTNAFGESSSEVSQLQEMFHKLNLDGTG